MSHALQSLVVNCFVSDWFTVAAKRQEEEEERARKEKAEKGAHVKFQFAKKNDWAAVL